MEIITDEELIKRINELKAETTKPFTRTLIVKKVNTSLARLVKLEEEGKIELPKKMTKRQSAMLAAKAWRSFNIGSRK